MFRTHSRAHPGMTYLAAVPELVFKWFGVDVRVRLYKC